jgi:hypothetical protein
MKAIYEDKQYLKIFVEGSAKEAKTITQEEPMILEAPIKEEQKT